MPEEDAAQLTATDRSPAHPGSAGRWAVNVTVHGIGLPARPLDDGEDQVWISVEQFEGLLDAAVGRPDVTVTFDDGNLSDLEIGLPRLLERGLKARFYIPAGLLGEPGRLDRLGGARAAQRRDGHRLARVGAPRLEIARLGPPRCDRGRGGDGARATASSDG